MLFSVLYSTVLFVGSAVWFLFSVLHSDVFVMVLLMRFCFLVCISMLFFRLALFLFCFLFCDSEQQTQKCTQKTPYETTWAYTISGVHDLNFLENHTKWTFLGHKQDRSRGGRVMVAERVVFKHTCVVSEEKG